MKTEMKKEAPKRKILNMTDITSREHRIYDEKKVAGIIKKNRGLHLQVSLLFEISVRDAIRRGADLKNIKRAFMHKSAKCIVFTCDKCPLIRKLGDTCGLSDEWEALMMAKTRKQMAESHNVWCEKTGMGAVYKNERNWKVPCGRRVPGKKR